MSENNNNWPLLGQRLPQKCVVFFCQVAIIFIVIITSIVNLSLPSRNAADDKLWIALLSSSIGYLLPSPNLGGRITEQR